MPGVRVYQGQGAYLEIVEHGLFDVANVMRSCLQVVDGVKHYFHCLVCNPVGCGEQRGIEDGAIFPSSQGRKTQTKTGLGISLYITPNYVSQFLAWGLLIKMYLIDTFPYVENWRGKIEQVTLYHTSCYPKLKMRSVRCHIGSLP